MEHMIDKRPQADRLLVAELYGEARHHARWRELSSDEETAAVAELRTLAGGRADLLAEVAGIFEGTSEGELDEPLCRQAACCAAGRCRPGGDPGMDRGGAAAGGQQAAAVLSPGLSPSRRAAVILLWPARGVRYD